MAITANTFEHYLTNEIGLFFWILAEYHTKDCADEHLEIRFPRYFHHKLHLPYHAAILQTLLVSYSQGVGTLEEPCVVACLAASSELDMLRLNIHLEFAVEVVELEEDLVLYNILQGFDFSQSLQSWKIHLVLRISSAVVESRSRKICIRYPTANYFPFTPSFTTSKCNLQLTYHLVLLLLICIGKNLLVLLKQSLST